MKYLALLQAVPSIQA